MARRATVIQEARQRVPGTLVLDAGNALVRDADPALSSRGASSIEALNRLGYDAVALGQADLNLGAEVLRQRLAEATAPFVSANVRATADGELLAEPFVVRNVAGHTVGVIGLTNPALPEGAPALDGLQVDDPQAALRHYLPELSRQAELIVLLSDLSVAKKYALAEEFPEIGMVLSAGSEPVDPPADDLSRLLVAQTELSSAGHAGRQFGILWLTMGTDGRRAAQRWIALPLGPEVPDDPDLAAWTLTQTR